MSGKYFSIKNLKVIQNYDKKNMILVDDNPFSYLYDNNNSIPILPFQGNSADKELLKLMKVLKNVFDC